MTDEQRIAWRKQIFSRADPPTYEPPTLEGDPVLSPAEIRAIRMEALGSIVLKDVPHLVADSGGLIFASKGEATDYALSVACLWIDPETEPQVIPCAGKVNARFVHGQLEILDPAAIVVRKVNKKVA